MSTQPLILKNGVITFPRSSTDTNNVVDSLGVVDVSRNQTIGGIKTFSSPFVLSSTTGTSIGTIWRNVDTLEYKDSTNTTKIILNSAGNLANLSNKQTALNNLVGTQTTNRVLRSNGTNVILSQVALDTDVINVLDITNGGTGSNTQNFVDLTTTQTVAGNKTLSGIVTITNATASTSLTTGGLVVVGGVAADHIKVKNAWLHEIRSSVTGVIDANALVFTNFAGTKWIDGGVTNLNLPSNAGMISQFDSLFGTVVESKYRVQEFLNVGTGTNARFWKRTENNSTWGTWLEIAFLEKANTWIGVQNITNATASTSTTTGALKISGGGSVVGNWYIGGSLVCTSTTVSFSALPTSSSGLSAGQLWRNGNVINIV